MSIVCFDIVNDVLNDLQTVIQYLKLLGRLEIMDNMLNERTNMNIVIRGVILVGNIINVVPEGLPRVHIEIVLMRVVCNIQAIVTKNTETILFNFFCNYILYL